jgi:hypothetical protein
LLSSLASSRAWFYHGQPIHASSDLKSVACNFAQALLSCAAAPLSSVKQIGQFCHVNPQIVQSGLGRDINLTRAGIRLLRLKSDN